MKTTPTPAWPVALSVGVPLAAYVATVSGYGYWLDGGEFVAQSVDFGISHPPGHPLAGVVMTLFAWLVPIGSIAFRVALLSALLTAFALGCLHVAARLTLQSVGIRKRDASLLAVAVCWTTAGTYGWWLQAVRPEVYALQAALICLAIERLVAFEFEWPHADARKLYVASLAFGLALANHHFLAFLLFPAGAATIARAVQARGMRPIGFGAAFITLGLGVYAYLPLRAVRPYLALGQPNDFGSFWWVVSAETFQKNQGEGVPQPLGERFADVTVQLADSLTLPVLFIALAGFYALIRHRPSRRVGVLWLLVLVVFFAARAWLGFVRSNPDALGYLMPAIAAIAVATAGFIASLLRFIGTRPKLTLALSAWCLLFAGFQIVETAPRASLASFRATDAFDAELRRGLPPRAVVITFAPQTAFRYWGGEAEEVLRPDVAFISVPFLAYPGMPDALVEQDETLRPLLSRYMLEGTFDESDLQTLATSRPVLVELDLRVDPSINRTLVPAGLYHQVIPDGSTRVDRREGKDVEAKTWMRLARLLEHPYDLETERQLVWRGYQRALFYADTGDRDAAMEAVKRALEIQPREQILLGLFQALQTPNEDGELTGPIDTAPFRTMD